MKKLLALVLLCMSLFIAACSDEPSNSEEKDSGKNSEGTEETANDTGETDEMAVKGALLDFQMQIIKTVNENDSAFYSFENAKGKEEDKPSADEIAKMKTDAQTASTKVAEDVRAIEIPAELDSYKEDIQSAMDDLAKSYENKAANLSDEAEAEYKESDDLFASFEEKMAKVYEDAGLTTPSFSADIAD